MTEIFYTKDHEWIKVNGIEGVVGITPYASEQLGDIVFVELPQKGISFEQGKDVAVIESVKAASEIYSPASGEIIETNALLEENPEIINDDPLNAGWLYKIKIMTKEDLKNLMNEEDYNKLIGV
jgi:glycine cleavage system H protein